MKHVEEKASSERLDPIRFGINEIERFNGFQDRVVLTNPALNDFFSTISHHISIPFDIQLNISKIYQLDSDQLDSDLRLSHEQLEKLSFLNPYCVSDLAHRYPQDLMTEMGLHSSQIDKLCQLDEEHFEILNRMSVQERQATYTSVLVEEITGNRVPSDDQPIGFFCRNDPIFVSCEAHLSSQTKIALIRYIDKLKLGNYEYKKVWEILIEKPLFDAFVLKLF